MKKFAVLLEELCATQLVKLQEMGFFDTQENIRTLDVMFTPRGATSWEHGPIEYDDDNNCSIM